MSVSQKYFNRLSEMLDFQSSSNMVPCLVKSRYLNKWQKRMIKIDCVNNSLEISREQENDHKVFSITESKLKKKPHQNQSNSSTDYQWFNLSIKSARDYEIKVEKANLNNILMIDKYPKIRQLDEMKVSEINPILNLNYYAKMRPHSFNEDYSLIRTSTLSYRQSMQVTKKLEDYDRIPSYLHVDDWRVDTKNGGLIFINEQKKSNISKIVKYVVKRAISTGSFMGISFPTFAMKPQSMLQTYCKCLGAVPLILKDVQPIPSERIKAFNAIVNTISIQFNDIDKPFNPTIGETFQGEIGGYEVCAQQTSHHPPVSSFMLQGENYVLHASLELNAKLGLNSAVGLFYGELVLEFDDGGVVKGRMPSGMMSGVLVGETSFSPVGSAYSYDPINHLVSYYQVKQKDISRGFIGKLKQKAENKFQKALKSSQKYEKFQSFSKNDFEEIKHTMEVIWTNQIKYDGCTYWKYNDQKCLPILMSNSIKNKLQSDSTYRQDIKMRANGELDESQAEKQKLEEEERRLRKLRNKQKVSQEK